MLFYRFILICALVLMPYHGFAQEVFSFGNAAMPDPRYVSVQSDTELNPMASLGTVEINDRGNWATGTSFSTGDKVTINGVSYVARQNHTSSASFSSDCSSGKWILHRSYQRSSFNVGRFLSLSAYGSSSNWASGSVYGFGSRVSWNGVQYVSWQRHTASSSFANDIGSGYWILYASAPDLSNYTMESPSGSTCEEFDAYFQSGETTLKGTVDIRAVNPSGTGENAVGTLGLEITFDWANEELKDYKLTLNMTSYPNMSSGGAYEVSWQEGDYSFTEFSFHTNSYNWNSINRCGRFILTFSKSHSVPPNETSYTSSSIYAKAHITFKQKAGRYVPVLSFLSTSPNLSNNTEYYSSIWDDGNLTYYNLETNAVIME